MTDIAAESPSKVGNFVISYSTDVQYIEDVACETIKNYFNNVDNNKLAQYFVDPDKAFIPRAFSNIETLEKEPADQDRVKALFDRSTQNPLNMAKRSGNVPGSSFQPDVIVSTSHHRPGPDGSPALVPPSAQGFGASNLSETGELFAPVRTLTFSDIDQNSQIEDSYVNESRLVSTPDKKDKNSGHYDYSNLLDRPYDPVGSLRRNNRNMNGQPEDSSDSENADERFGSQSPEFRQLEGEAENEPLTNTVPFNPSMHGLSKEFMDQFVGKTSHQGYGDVFSPLGSNVFHVAERRMQSATPPLHSPAPNSPYAKYAKGSPASKSPRSPKYQQSPRGQGQGRSDYDADEIQFVNSPTRIVHPSNRDVIGHGANTAKSYSHGYLGNASMLHTAKGRSFSHQDVNQDYSFQPIEKQPTSSAPRNIPKNLNEYFDHHDREQEAKAAMYLNNYQFETAYEDQYGDDLDIESRQGDGSVSDGDTGASRGTFNHATNPGTAHDGSTSPEPDQKGVPRTQVSVRLPQPTYDTLSGVISNGNHFLSYPTSPPPPPDVALTVQEINDNDADTHENGAAGNKVMDLLQNQSSVDSGEHYERDSNLNTADVDSSSAHVTSLKTAIHVSQKSKDTGQPQTGPISSNSYLELPTQQHQSLDNFQVPSKLPVSQANNSRSQGGVATVGMKPHDSVPSQVNLSQPYVSTAPTSGGINSQGGVLSRLLQETASHRSKTTQKYVSTQPQVVPKTSTTSVNGSKPSQEFKKPVDVCPKAVISSVHVPSQGAKKTLVNETANKFKVSDRAKPKSTSMETLPQRQQKSSVNNANQSKAVEHGANGTHFRSSTSSSNQPERSKNPGQPKATDNSAGYNDSLDENVEASRLVTQVQKTSPVHVQEQQERRNQSRTPGDSTLDLAGMEEVRHQLQSMMRLSQAHMSPQERSQYEHSDILAGFGVDFGDQATNMDMSWAPMRKPDEEIQETFPSFSSQYFTDSGNHSRSDASVHAENQRLRDMLEKERYRRRHCEQYIQQLNVKLLETQQQVAVAVSTDKRKDIMIEQLDKQLARVMEGWKKRDQEKEEMMEELRKEKEEIEDKMMQQKQMINNFEHDMSEAVDALRKEKEKAAHEIEELKAKLQDEGRRYQHTGDLLEGEREKVGLLQQECESLREGRETLDKKLDNMQRRLHREQDEWFQREQELLQRIEEVSDKNTKILQSERAKNEEQVKLAEEIMDQYQETTNRLKKMELELDAALREKESVKVEMSIMEAKFENAQRVLEADLHSTMEKQIAEQIADVQARHEVVLDETREKHRQQILDLSRRNGTEMERQLAVFKEEVARKEDEFRKQFQEMETRLMEYRNENSELKRSKQRLESTRLEILTKLQYAMQSQWNEALSLLSATPQRRTTQSRTDDADDTNSSILTTSTSIPAVNFSLLTPRPQPANQASESHHSTNQKEPHTPPRQQNTNQSHAHSLTNQISPTMSSAIHLSPVLGKSTNQDHGSILSPGRESYVSHSTEKDRDDANIETAALSHLKQFQDYLNSFTKTPEWISTINSQAEMHGGGSVTSTPRLPSPPEIAALLSTHLHNIQHMAHHPAVQSQSGQAFHPVKSSVANQMQGARLFNQPSHSLHSASQPNSLLTNQRELDLSQQHSSLPASLNFQPISSTRFSVNQTETPPPRMKPSNQIELSHSNLNQTDITVYSDLANQTAASMPGMLWEGSNRAVPIRPPQQCDDAYANEDNQSIISGVSVGVARGYFQGGQSFSPPTRQHRDSENNSVDDLTHQSYRLNEDYSDLSERVQRHESHQNELQHYIQLLLNRSPNEANTSQHTDSVLSQDNEDLDLNDTAQAAQLQRELDRIQELRTKQEVKQGSAVKDAQTSKILSPDQIEEVTKLLNQVKGQGQLPDTSLPSNPQVAELIKLLSQAQLGNQSVARKPGRQHGNHGNHYRAIGVRRNVHFNPSKGAEGGKQESKKPDKSQQLTPSGDPKVAQLAPAKKVERKLAGAVVKGEKPQPGSATKGDKSQKPAAWK